MLEIYRETFGREHPDTARAIGNLGLALSCQGRHAEAETFLDEALEMQRRILPDAHPELATTLVRLPETRCAMDRPAAAEANAREALSIRRDRLPERHWLTADAESVLGVCLTKQGHFAEAEPLLSRAYNAIRAAHGTHDPRTLRARQRLHDLRAQIRSDPDSDPPG